MTTFLGGIQLVKNIQVFAYKNDNQHWLALHKDDKFIDFVTYGPEIGGLIASNDGKWFAYLQRVSDKDMISHFTVWKHVQVSETEHEIVPYCELRVQFGGQICFNSAGTHVACLALSDEDELTSMIYVVDLRRLDVPTEFYILNCRNPVIFDACNSFICFGQDEYAKVIDLTTKHLTMWRYKLKNTKYLFVHKGRVVHMSNAGIVGVFNVNLQEKRLGICYDVKYPTGNYEDITFDEHWKVVLHKKNGETYLIE